MKPTPLEPQQLDLSLFGKFLDEKVSVLEDAITAHIEPLLRQAMTNLLLDHRWAGGTRLHYCDGMGVRFVRLIRPGTRYEVSIGSEGADTDSWSNALYQPQVQAWFDELIDVVRLCEEAANYHTNLADIVLEVRGGAVYPVE